MDRPYREEDRRAEPPPVAPEARTRWRAEDFARVSTAELARLAGADVLESEAYFELWRRTHALVSDIVHRRLRGQDARHTVTAFYCHKLPRVLPRYAPRTASGSTFEAWLTTVLKNYLNDEWRRGRTRRQREYSLDDDHPATRLRAAAVAEPPRAEQQSEQDHLAHFLGEIMNQMLSPEDRFIFRARYWEDRSMREIAAALGLSEENVRVRHFRAKKRLQKVCAIYRESGLL